MCNFCDIGRIADKQLGEQHRLEREATELMADVAKVIVARYPSLQNMGGPRPYDGLIEVLQREVIKQLEWVPTKAPAVPMNLHPSAVMRINPREKTARVRMSHSKVMRVFARDNFKCIICGTSRELTVDHIIPLINGGDYEEENLASMCQIHNSKKSDRTMSEFLKGLPFHEKRHYYKSRATLVPRPVAGELVVWRNA